MGSYSSSATSSNAQDNRQAATDSAQIVRGGALYDTKGGNVFNLNAGGFANAAAAKSGGFGGANSASTQGGSAKGGTINFQVLDNGAIGNAFQFADNALSMMLTSIIEGQKLEAETATYTADTLSQALQQSAAINSAAAAAATAAQGEIEAGTFEKYKNLILAGGAVLAVWWVWGRK